MSALDVGILIPLIALLPIAGAVLNGFFGRLLGKRFVKFVAVAAPATAFIIALAMFVRLVTVDNSVAVTARSVATLETIAERLPQELRQRAEPQAWNPQLSGQRVERLQRSLADLETARQQAEDAEARAQLDERVTQTQTELAQAEADLAAEQTRHADYKALLARWEAAPPAIEGSPEEGMLLRVYGLSGPDDEVLAAAIGARDASAGWAKTVAPRVFTSDLGSWIAVAGFEVRFQFLLDRLALLMVLVITGVGTLIHIYSTGYMEDQTDGGFARYFTYLNLFVGAMLVLVLGANLFLLFVGWEGVGLCSYLLIGFDYHKADSAACGTKAFVVNRIGDIGFVLGMLTLLVAARDAAAGGTFGVDIQSLNGLAHQLDPELLGVACVLLFIGATGKSAQIPLHLWLPDAMAGPTPVSALIHAATMVTAGIYMIARMSPIFIEATFFGIPVLSMVAVVGVLTAFFAGTAALAQNDIKRVLAYSTVSQLGYMFVGVGTMAFGAAVFHLVTHAFFKALLFLGSGSVIHACHSQDMRQMGGLRKHMPTTYWTFLIGSLALGGFPLMSGFFSKDLILFEVLAKANAAHSSWAWWPIYLLGVLTALITAVYTTRMVILTFFGEYRGQHVPHESPLSMTMPLVVLANLAILAALLGLPEIPHQLLPVSMILPHFIEPSIAVHHLDLALETKHSLEIFGLLLGGLLAVGGLGLGVYAWYGRSVSQIAWERPQTPWLRRLRDLLSRAWMYDEIVNKKGIQPGVLTLSRMLWRWVDDETIDRGLVDGTGRVGMELSNSTRTLQNGRVARYAGYFAVGATAIPLLALSAPWIYQWARTLLIGG